MRCVHRKTHSTFITDPQQEARGYEAWTGRRTQASILERLPSPRADHASWLHLFRDRNTLSTIDSPSRSAFRPFSSAFPLAFHCT
ncbi:hypothetical protein M378DRAFT_805800 [Amanita muscaria Koide BX008]|uniref:Uncharacterized protein n=1 Tax=Amanita muscaria (strain Koide BX008) TaxID=946122 RepID=A0A0C2T6D1_AMAMK|nr:hypothetical protein M378DRAFT_805800 [Amanita muscaria Koide BX008]